MPDALEKVESRYDRWSRFYDIVDSAPVISRRQREWKRLAVDDLMLRKGHRVLDIGTGSGELLPMIAERRNDVEIVGVDISRKMLEVASERTKEYGNIRLVREDVSSLTFPDGYFDSAIASFAMTTFPDPKGALKEAARVVKPGGKIVILDTGKPEKGLARVPHLLMTPVARLFGRTHIDRDIEKVASKINGIKKVKERRHYGGMVYCAVWERE